MEDWDPPNAAYAPPKIGEPPLHRAARMGDHEAIARLLRDGADVDDAFDIGLDPGARPNPATPLMVAAGSGDGASLETVELLLKNGADPRVVLASRSAAAFACTGLGWNYRPGGGVERLQALLAAGSPLPDDPAQSNRLLCAVASSGDSARLRVLLDLGLNAGGHFDPTEAESQARENMASIAAFRGTADLDLGLPPELLAEMEASMREFDVEMIERQSSAPSPFEIPLFCAAESGNAECVRLLLQAGADPFVRDNSRRTAMYQAVSIEVVQTLLATGLPLEDADQFEWSPLDAAVTDGETALPRIRALLSAGADVNATHDHGYTVFMSAVGSGRCPEVLRLLVAAGADPHAVSDRGYNAFHAAIDVNGEVNAEESVRDTLGYLKELGVELEGRNAAGHTPLARATQEGTGIEVRVLCDLGADPNALGPRHSCAGDDCERVEEPLLFHAVDGVGVHRDEKAAALLQAGADPLIEDAEGFRPLVRAVARLCSEAEDYDSCCQSIFDEFDCMTEVQPHATKDDFIAVVRAQVLKRIESIVNSSLPPSESEHTSELRRELVACVASLSAYEAWVRTQNP